MMFRVAPLSALAVIFMFAGVVQAQYYTTYYYPTTAYYQPATVYHAPAPATTVYYASEAAPADPCCCGATPTTTYTTAYYAPATTYYAARPTVVYYAPRPRYYSYYRWW